MTLPAVIGILGEKEAGKDTIATVLVETFGYTRRAFGDKLKREAAETLDSGQFPRFEFGPHIPDDIRGIVSAHRDQGFRVFEKPTSPEMRRLLQWWGTDFRRTMEPDYWVRFVAADLPELLVITDVRFPNELEFIRSCGGVAWKVVRPKVASIESGLTENHVSEALAKSDVEVDEIILNDSTVAALQDKVLKLLGVEQVPPTPAVEAARPHVELEKAA